MTDTNRPQTDRPTRLKRSRDDRVLAGVSGGLGAHLGINPWWFRLAFVVLAFFGGLGVLAYVAAWLVIPDEGYRDPIISQWLGRLDTRDGGTIFGLILVGTALVILLMSVADVSGTLVVALVLFVVGLLLYRGDLTTSRPPAPRDEMPADDEEGPSMADEPYDRSLDDGAGDAEATPGTAATIVASDDAPYEPAPPAPPTPPVQPPPPRPPRERSMLGRLTVAIGLIVIATMALIDVAFDRVHIEPVYYLATAVGVAGIGLLVGAWIGRARWLILVAVLLLPALWFTSLWPDDFSFTAGEVREQPAAVAAVEDEYDLGFGQLTIDLTDLTAGELAQVGRIDVSLGIGEIILRIPEDTGAEIIADIGMGALQGPFSEAAGVGVDTTRTVGPDPVVVEIHAEVGAGVVTVQHLGEDDDGRFEFNVDSSSVFERSN